MPFSCSPHSSFGTAEDCGAISTGAEMTRHASSVVEPRAGPVRCERQRTPRVTGVASWSTRTRTTRRVAPSGTDATIRARPGGASMLAAIGVRPVPQSKTTA
jgi:hypothetical protein